MEALPMEKQYNLTHHQQRFNWDCGISCILMILSNPQRQFVLDNFADICAEEGFGISVWTIDLCYLLKRWDINHIFYTKTIGVDQNYRLHSYYDKVIDRDTKRVEQRFEAAKEHGIIVEQLTLPMQALIDHLSMHGPIILLTNASMLKCNRCKKNVMDKFGYTGHYITLCGYNLNRQEIYYRDPGLDGEHICLTSIEDLETARKAYGTDEDVVFIFQ